MAYVKRSTVYPLLVFILLFSSGVFLTFLLKSLEQQEQQLLLGELVATQTVAVERRLELSFSAAFMLAQEVRHHSDDLQYLDQRFNEYAASIIDSLGGVANLQLAPQGVIRNIYPLAGQEKAIGHNLLRDDVRRDEAQLAIDTKKMILAGPFTLLQGGVAIVGRHPVFIEQGDQSTFWGFTSVVIFAEDLLAMMDLPKLADNGYVYQLTAHKPLMGNDSTVIFTSPDFIADGAVSKTMQVLDETWTLTVNRTAFFEPLSLLGQLISFFIALVLALLMSRYLREPERLRAVVKKTTIQLERMAFCDDLTGLANRRCLSEHLDKALRNLRRNGPCLAVMYLDLDEFKRINDSMGHDVGDQLLCEIARRIRSIVRSSDIVCRLGGDEFAVVLCDLDSAGNASRVAKKIIAAVSEPLALKQHQVVVSVTVGITIAPHDGQSSRALFSNADLALYASKAAGKNQFSFFNPRLQRDIDCSLLVEEALRRAVYNEEFHLLFQPIISLRTARVAKFEALLRWRHPAEGEKLPTSFISVAEMTGLIVPIGCWVLRSACQFIQQQKARGGAVKPVAVNVSVRQLKDAKFAARVKEIMEEFAIEPNLLELEITESLLIDDMGLAIKLIVYLSGLGISISIDDFGAGYSSLAQLKKFPINTLKIDRSFINDLAESDSSRQIVEGVVVMAQKLAIEVIAEGIETAQQLDYLQSFGCDFGQGFLFAKPLSAEEALQFISAESKQQLLVSKGT